MWVLSLAGFQANLAGSNSQAARLPCPQPLSAAEASPLSWAASLPLLA